MSFDDSNSPKYQKFKVDKLPKIIKFENVDCQLLLAYYKHKYNKTIKAVQRRNGKTISTKIVCPKCGHLMTIFTITMVIMVNINVKFVVSPSKKRTSPPLL